MTEPSAATPTAAVLVIGNEILSGRTQDANLAYLARELGTLGIRLKEARVVADEEAAIIEALNALRARYRYVFTTGGIGPTHDDITSECIAKAFGRAYTLHPEAHQIMIDYCRETGRALNEARLRMAHLPEGAALIENKVSRAPGFRVENVFVMAGIPAVMRAMFEAIAPSLETGPSLVSRAFVVFLPEGAVAKDLGQLQARSPGIDIGSYPFVREGRFGTTLVLRGTDREGLDRAAAELVLLLRGLGGEPVEENTA
jgi:molybdenum cofactor synthesis domain-containing protein